ncbi:MAG: hypothetical protein E7058_09635 [Lentisphaerae bacterium]|nr:hypothetical protein [Lentisphaerota bacterium]
MKNKKFSWQAWKFCTLFGLFVSGYHCAFAAEKNGNIPAVYTVKGQLNEVGRHAQGACASNDALFLSYAGGIYKLNWQGSCVKHVKTPVHTGDICFFNGKVYAAVAYAGDGAIIELSSDLEVLQEHKLKFPIDGITVLDDHFYFGVGPTPPGMHRGNRIGRIPVDFSTEPQIMDIDHGYETRYGTQCLSAADGQLFASFYGDRKQGMLFAVFDKNGKLIKPMRFNANYGFAVLPGRFNSALPRFLRVIQLYSKNRNELPYFRFDFYELRNGRLVNITRLPAEPVK